MNTKTTTKNKESHEREIGEESEQAVGAWSIGLSIALYFIHAAWEDLSSEGNIWKLTYE